MKRYKQSLLLAVISVAGCRSHLIDQADRQVYDAIQQSQQAALGATSDVHIGEDDGAVSSPERMYSFNPRPVTADLPENFRKTKHEAASSTETADVAAEMDADRAADSETSTDDEEQGADLSAVDALMAEPSPEDAGPPMSKEIYTEDQMASVKVFGLREALRYASRHARRLQDAKETLYLAALDLTLERHLWTPQFVGSIRSDFADYGQVRDFDRAMTAVSDFAVSQQLPYGGEVTARIVNSLMRDLGVHTTSGETGSVILSADLPLLRGAGKVAYESRYSAERNLIYAARTYERFRRAFLVEVASDYFGLQGLKSAIDNTYASYKSRREDWIKADYVNRMGQANSIFFAPRAKSSFRRAEAGLVSAKERYETQLDQFKIFLGMPVDELLDVVDQSEDQDAVDLDELLPEVEAQEAIDVAMRFRLDYLNVADRVDDARRGVKIAENSLLPDLDASLSATVGSDPERFNSASFNTERTTWRGSFELRMDDRKRERNAYRESLINTRSAERDLDLFEDQVRADVRRALRRIGQQEDLRVIQELQVRENLLRAEAARAQFDLGMTTNQDVVDAEDELLAARNNLAEAISAYRGAILEFRRDTGTLRVGDQGEWVAPDTPDSGDPADTGP